MELIDKDALVAGLKNMIDDYWSDSENTMGIYPYALEKAIEYAETLEVKEVDFEKELDRIWFDNKLGNYFDNDALDFAHVRTLCKHFFELGLNTKKENKCNIIQQ